jgi:cation-transporting P-type ATPase F
MQRILDEHCHHIPAEEVLGILGVDSSKGLDLFEVEHRRERFGLNLLKERKGRNPVLQFLLQFHQPLVYVLLASALITAIMKGYVEATVIFGVVLVNAVIGFIQESKALKAIHALSRSLTSSATVLRAGNRLQLPSEALVPGDMVLLQSGDKVPADLRLIQVRDLQIDESALTGEPVPTQKDTQVLARATSLGDRNNMAFSSTLVTYGTGAGVVVATGDQTEVGKISVLIATAEALETPLTLKIRRFSSLLLYAVFAMAAVAFAVGLMYGEKPVEMFMASVALAIGAIPEGLPAAVTIIMAIGVARMATRRTIIRRLPAVETLGSTTVICSDKTGTLTQNQMTVQNIFAGGESYDVSGSGYAPTGEIRKGGVMIDAVQYGPLLECLRCGLLCNDSEIIAADGLWKVQGDPTEGALLSAARKGSLSRDYEQRQLPRVDTIPFESQHQYMATLHDQGEGLPRIAFMKGSLESLLDRCGLMVANGREVSLDAEWIRREVEAMARTGLRVLAFARKEMPPATAALRHQDVEHGLVFIGLQGMMDPPRPEAARAVAACQKAGIRVKMITGDHAATAASIARQIGITGACEPDGTPRVAIGRDLENLTDQELIEAAENIPVFARVSPEQKLRLVEALQARGHVVAMTGDGVNDAPALRKANIGVAMALGGTEVAREAADMVLTDDNFASIEAAVEEGRGVFDNLQKFIVWTLPTNGGEGLVILIAVLMGIPLPILPVQILWINMMTAICLGVTLSFEPKERGIMDRPPNKAGSPILDSFLIQRILLVSVLLCAGAFAIFEWLLAQGSTVAEARTGAVAMIVFGELFFLFNCRSLRRSFLSTGMFSNPYLWLGSSLMVVLQIAFTHMPLMNRLFGSQPLDGSAWLLVLAFSLLVSFVIGIEKFLRVKLSGGKKIC